MYYGVKYTVQFSSVGTAQDYKFEILEKNYLGNFYSLDPARSPVRHSCEIDDPVTPIKGTKLSLSYVNDGPVPLNTFYAQALSVAKRSVVKNVFAYWLVPFQSTPEPFMVGEL